MAKKKEESGVIHTVYAGNICVMPDNQRAFLSGSFYLILIHACSNIHKQFSPLGFLLEFGKEYLGIQF